MNRPAEIKATLSALPHLYGGPRPLHRALQEFATGAQSVADQAARWSPLTPKPAEIATARNALTGLQRLIGEIGQHAGLAGDDE